MKRLFVATMVLMLAFSVLALAGPYVAFDYTIADDAALRLGYITDGPLTLELSVVDLFTVPGLGFKGIYAEKYNYWDSKATLWIDKIDPVTNYPIPTVEGLGVKWRGIVHIGSFATLLGDVQTSSSTFDIYGEVSLALDPNTFELIPTGSLGFYWEP